MEKSGSAGVSIQVPIPATEQRLYGSSAIDSVLLFLSRHPYDSYTAGELADSIEASTMTIRRAIDVLAANDLVEYKPQGNAKPVQINRTRLSNPTDPILRIPQPEFHKPVDAACQRVKSEVDGVLGIVLFGSVARGEADRRSDIDLWMVVNENRAAKQRTVSELRMELEEERFDGQRYAFHMDVESIDSVPTYTDAIQEIIRSGITIYETDQFRKLEALFAHHSGESSGE